MLILAFESSAKPVSVAVYDAPDANSNAGFKLLGQYYQNTGLSHSRTLMSMTDSLLINLGIKPVDIGLVAVANGPGSFTGVRIGVSAAKGFAFGLDIPVCGVSTLEAMAWQMSFTEGIICPVMDARRDQVYTALFEWRDGILVRLCDDRAISIEELALEIKGSEFGYLLVGDGVEVCNKGFRHLGCYYSPDFPTINLAEEPLRYQTAYGVALAALKTNRISATELEPFYLRPSQAERERLR